MTAHLLLALFLLLLGTANSESQAWSQQRLVSFSGGANTSEKSSKVLMNSSSNTTLQAVDASSPTKSLLLHSDGANKEHEYSCSRPWFYPKNSSKNSSNGSTVCECGSPVGYTVRCSTESQQLQVLVCYCMTYNKETASLLTHTTLFRCGLMLPT